jgi:putative PIN family toxin of toxin-antitoxin system
VGARRIVIDTNVIVSALRSASGYSFKLLSIIDDERISVALSVPLILEYEDVVKRDRSRIKLTRLELDDVSDYFCRVAEHRRIFYLWRPYLKDPKDDMVLELAVEAECEFIVTFNKKDFEGIEEFGLKAVTPKEFLGIIGEKA